MVTMLLNLHVRVKDGAGVRGARPGGAHVEAGRLLVQLRGHEGGGELEVLGRHGHRQQGGVLGAALDPHGEGVARLQTLRCHTL